MSQLVSVLVSSHADGGPLVWLPGGLLLAVLMSTVPSRWLPCVTGIVLGVALAAALPDGPAIQNGGPLVFTLVLVPLGAHVMRILCNDASPLRTFRNLGGFLGLFVLALPIGSSAATLLAAYPGGARGQGFDVWLHVAFAHALGYLLFVPFWFKPRARWATLQRMFVPDSWPAIASLAAIAAIALVWNAFGSLSYVRPLLLLAPIPVLVFTALRARVAGAFVLVVLVAIVAVQLSRAGRGPFIEGDESLTALSFMSWILATGVASWLLAVLIEQRVDMRRALVHSSREVRELAGRLIEAQEQERSRIARDLHDDINQRLASVSIELSAIRRSAGAAGADLAHVQDELIALSEDVRHLSHNLHPSMLHETGLEAALGSLCNTQRHRNGPSIDVHVMPNADNLPDAIALCLYRAAQEALGNAIRHARARAIDVRLGVVDQLAELRVDDDGIGFSTTGEAARRRGLGLLSLEERAKLLGGSFELNTSPGKGTHVCIRIPLSSQRPR
ncbi:MAG TPA: ATP-binding protein [Rhodanobacteraceae bacterium]|nr:ATP-binding protein [Rhodanobacteraceae bacterium]